MESVFEYDFVDEMIKENQEIWDKMINNEFCLQLAKGTADIVSFRWYMVQDMLYLKNNVAFKIGFIAKGDWASITTAFTTDFERLTKSVRYVDGQIATCTGALGIRPEVVHGAVPAPHVKAYCDYLMNSLDTEDWFSLHVMMLPCLVGYNDIGNKYIENPITDKDSIYYKHWISQNVGNSSPGRYRAWLNAHLAAYDSPAARINWKRLFRQSCEMEIGFWELCLTNKL